MISIFTNWKNPVRIENLEIDTVLREDHRYSNIITNYPVEKDADITDHIQQKPEVLILEGLTSNTPVRFVSENFKELLREDNSNRMQIAFNVLLGYAGYSPPKQPNVEPVKVSEPQILTIVTGYKVYTQMAISHLTFPRGRESGEAANYRIEFKKIRFVEAEFTEIQKTSSLGGKAENIDNQAAKTQNTGKNTAKEEPQTSLLLQSARTVKGWLGF